MLLRVGKGGGLICLVTGSLVPMYLELLCDYDGNDAMGKVLPTHEVLNPPPHCLAQLLWLLLLRPLLTHLSQDLHKCRHVIMVRHRNLLDRLKT